MKTMGKKSTICMVLGSLLLAASLGLSIYNVLDNGRAGAAVQAATDQLEEMIPQQKSIAVKAPLSTPVVEEEIPDYVLNPEMDMPVVFVDGYDYIGTLELPTLGLKLPVMSDWDYPRLKLAPCRYAGSAYQGNMVIAAHNYTNHFGPIKNLKIGDQITFTDSDGNVFSYSVAEIETLDPYDVDDMLSGNWDLTLFTCTVGGQSRVTVRCEACD